MGLLAYGYYDLVAGEESSTEWMPNITANVQRLATHSHDGIDSAPISISSLAKTTRTIPKASWVVDGAGYKQTVAMPSSFTYANTFMAFYISKDGDPYDGSIFYPTTIKTGASQYDIYVSDNTIDVVVVYI
jgi:hypothetical protein